MRLGGLLEDYQKEVQKFKEEHQPKPYWQPGPNIINQPPPPPPPPPKTPTSSGGGSEGPIGPKAPEGSSGMPAISVATGAPPPPPPPPFVPSPSAATGFPTSPPEEYPPVPPYPPPTGGTPVATPGAGTEYSDTFTACRSCGGGPPQMISRFDLRQQGIDPNTCQTVSADQCAPKPPPPVASVDRYIQEPKEPQPEPTACFECSKGAYVMLPVKQGKGAGCPPADPSKCMPKVATGGLTTATPTTTSTPGGSGGGGGPTKPTPVQTPSGRRPVATLPGGLISEGGGVTGTGGLTFGGETGGAIAAGLLGQVSLRAIRIFPVMVGSRMGSPYPVANLGPNMGHRFPLNGQFEAIPVLGIGEFGSRPAPLGAGPGPEPMNCVPMNDGTKRCAPNPEVTPLETSASIFSIVGVLAAMGAAVYLVLR